MIGITKGMVQEGLSEKDYIHWLSNQFLNDLRPYTTNGDFYLIYKNIENVLVKELIPHFREDDEWYGFISDGDWVYYCVSDYCPCRQKSWTWKQKQSRCVEGDIPFFFLPFFVDNTSFTGIKKGSKTKVLFDIAYSLTQRVELTPHSFLFRTLNQRLIECILSITKNLKR